MRIFCVSCDKEVDARMTTGNEVYPHREDLYHLSFLVCDACGNYKSFNGTKSPTLIPSPELRRLRLEIHAILDPLWKSKRIGRGQAYAYVSHRMGYPYHNESLKSVEDGEKAKEIVKGLASKLEIKEK